jgi:DNA-binding MarR family transcriptional regulator
MHGFFFRLKRAHHLTNWHVRKDYLDEHGLTPSRFDILFLLSNSAAQMTQLEMRKRIGCASSTLSRMVMALVKKHVVSRVRNPRDKRAWIVRLTTFGRWLAAKTFRVLFGEERFAHYAPIDIFEPTDGCYHTPLEEHVGTRKLQRATQMLRRIERYFTRKRRSDMPYPSPTGSVGRRHPRLGFWLLPLVQRQRAEENARRELSRALVDYEREQARRGASA